MSSEQALEMPEPEGEGRQAIGKGLLAVGGVLGALAASSCCVIPLVLLSFGVSGAWMGTLTALAPYNTYIVAFTLACLGVGFYLVYRKPKMVCADGGACARPLPTRIVKGALWSATILILVALGTKYVAPTVLGIS